MKPTLALSLILLLIVASCAPTRLVPYDFTPRQNNSQAYVELDDVVITFENLEIQNDHYVFGVGIKNNSEGPLLIDKDKILKYADYLSYEEANVPKKSKEVVPVMSSKETLQLFETKGKNAKTAGFLLFLMSAAITTFDVVQDTKDNSKEYWTKKDERKSVTRDVITGVGRLASEVFSEITYRDGEKAETELTYLPDELFNKKVIAPGEEYYGKIFFKKPEERHEYHRITWRIQDYDLLFDFRMATSKENKFLKNQGY